ncbi:MAG: ankyrin repeat domain-containing protein [Legionella sp.]|nr:ankyrin repeat domain-containing protein [Legionella sp.]
MFLIDFIKQSKERTACFFRCILGDRNLLSQIAKIEKKLRGKLSSKKIKNKTKFDEELVHLIGVYAIQQAQSKALIKYKNTTPLHALVMQDDLTPLSWLISFDVDLNALTGAGYQNEKKVAAIHLAAERGADEIVSALCCAGADVNIQNNHGETPAFIAAENGHAKVLNILGKYQANFELKNNLGETAVFTAVKHNQISALLQLEKFKVNFNQISNDGLTAIHVAASRNHYHVLKILAANKADFDKRTNNSEGMTAAYIAAEKGHLKFIQLLVEFGADLNKPSKLGLTLLEVAEQEGHQGIIDYLHGYEAIFKMLCDCGLNIKFINQYILVFNQHPFHEKIREILQMLSKSKVLDNPMLMELLFKGGDVSKLHYFIRLIDGARGLPDLQEKNQADQAFKEQRKEARKYVNAAIRYADKKGEDFVFHCVKTIEDLGLLQGEYVKNNLDAVIDYKNLALLYHCLSILKGKFQHYVQNYVQILLSHQDIENLVCIVVLLEEQKTLKPDNIDAVLACNHFHEIVQHLELNGMTPKSAQHRQVEFEKILSQFSQPSAEDVSRTDKAEDESEDKRAFLSFSITARKGGEGEAYAQFKMGCFYEKGLHVKQNVKEAITWYKKSGKKGCHDAYLSLGNMLYDGSVATTRQTRINYRAVIKYYSLAANLGNVKAQLKLGLLLQKGEGELKANPEEATKWLTMAANQGDELAIRALQQIDAKPEKQAEEEASHVAERTPNANRFFPHGAAADDASEANGMKYSA